MSSRRQWQLLIVMVGVVLGLGWLVYRDYRREQFLENLQLVGFSTSLIGSPREGAEEEAHLRARALGIDLLKTYQEYSDPDDSVRYQLAWMLITRESPEYCELAEKNIAQVPWPEVRIWKMRRNDESLSREYRAALLNLLLASPTSEGQLAAGRWYLKQGEQAKAEDAFHAAMTRGLFWDALDAADELLQLKSERYRAAAIAHHLKVVRDSEHFTKRAAGSLLTLFGRREEFDGLLEACRKEPQTGPNRQQLVAKLQELIAREKES